MKLTFNHDEAKGEIELREENYGATILINGREAAFIDLYPCVEGAPPQIIFDGLEDENFAKVVYTDPVTLFIHKDMDFRVAQKEDEHTINTYGDYVFIPQEPAYA